MASNRERRSIRIREHSSSLLTGLITDKDGSPFTPSFTVKNKKRYRYYVLRRSIENPSSRVQTPARWPAIELETVVLDVVQSFLSSEAQVFREYDNEDTSNVAHELVSAAKKLADRWPNLAPGKTRNFVESCVRRVVVDRDSVAVQLDKVALSKQLLGHDVGYTQVSSFDKNSAPISLKSRAKLRRCGGEVCLLIPATGGDRRIGRRPVSSLVKAIVRARLWYERLLSGEVKDCTALAAGVGLGDRYVARVLHFAFLAPDIVESILDGTQPPDLTFAKMATNIPLSWVEQRERFGFTALPA